MRSFSAGFFIWLGLAITGSLAPSASLNTNRSDATPDTTKKDSHRTNYPTGTICIQTFNAYGPAYAPRRAERAQALARLVRQSANCRFLHLQEVWTEAHLQEIREAFVQQGMVLDGFPFPSLDFRFGLAAFQFKVDHPFYRNGLKPSLVPFAHNYRGLSDWLRKLLSIGKAAGFYYDVEPETGAIMLMINTHLHHSSQVLRLAQLIELATELERRQPLPGPVILTGDLNAEPQSLELQLLTNVLGFRDARANLRGCTYCQSNSLSWSQQDHTFDYILFQEHETYAVHVKRAEINFQSSEGVVPSDHYGVSAELAISERADQPPTLEPDTAITNAIINLLMADGGHAESIRQLKSLLKIGP